MTGTFKYRPKFVDISASKRGATKVDKKPQGRPCDHTGCDQIGEHRAPKARERNNEFWYFCTAHAADYNRRWNYFAGMSDTELAEYHKAAETGHRPTWSFRAAKNDRLSAAAQGVKSGKRRPADPFEMFGPDGKPTPEAAPRKKLTRLQKLSLEALDLDENADAATIRAKYAEQVKRWHPDSNGGDRAAEGRLQKVVHAYQTLKQGGLV